MNNVEKPLLLELALMYAHMEQLPGFKAQAAYRMRELVKFYPNFPAYMLAARSLSPSHSHIQTFPPTELKAVIGQLPQG
jgi:hypothetical protein